MSAKKYPSLEINSFSNWVALALSVFIGFIITPFIIDKIGNTGYGIWTLISAIVGYYGILDLGITSAITRYVALYSKQKDYGALNETVSTSLIVFFVIGFVVILVSFFIAKPLSVFFDISLEYAKSFSQLILLLGITIGVGFPGKLFSAIIRAHEHFVLANSVSIFITLIREKAR